jgi:PST family polysaccharide transporter
MEEKALRGVPWTLLAYIGSRAVTLVSTLVLARILVPADFGLVALAIMLTSFLAWFGNLGFAKTLILRQDLDRRGQGTLLTLTMASSVLAALLGIGLAPVAANAFDEPRLSGILMALSGALLLSGFASFYEALLRRELEFRRRFVAYALQSVSGAAISISLAATGTGVWSLVAGQVVGYAALALTMAALAPYRVRPRYQRKTVPTLVRESGGFITQGITIFIRSNTDTVAVARAFGAAQLGFYSMAYRLGDLSYWAIAGPVADVSFPAFARARQRGEDIRGGFLSVLRMMALVGVPFGLILSAAAEPLTRALFGEKWLSMVGPLSILGLWAALRPLESTFNWTLNSIGRAGAAAWVSIAVLVPLVPGVIVATQVGRLTAVAIVIVADEVVATVALSFLARRHLDVSMGAMWAAIQPVILAAPAMWVATWGAGRAIGDDHPLIALLVAPLAGLAVYGLVISCFDRRLLPRAGTLVLRTLGRGATPAPPEPVSTEASASGA